MKKYRNWLFGKDGALFQASAKGDLATAKNLVEQGANINARSSEGYTPLHRAAQNGHREMVKYLLSMDADIDTQSENGDTPEGLAEENGHTDIAGLIRTRRQEIS